MSVALLAHTAVKLLLEGAATKIGGDVYSTALERLKGFFAYKFGGRPELTQVKQNPEALATLVENEALQEEAFRQELEKLVNQIQEAIKKAPAGSTNYNNGDSVTNQDIGTISGINAGRDIGNAHL